MSYSASSSSYSNAFLASAITITLRPISFSWYLMLVSVSHVLSDPGQLSIEYLPFKDLHR